MVGNKNGSYVGRGFVSETDMTAPQQIMTANSTYTGILNSNGSPEGVLSGNPGSIAMDRTNGEVYKKKSGTGNTGWELLQVAGGGGGTWTLLDQYTLTGGETTVDFTDLSASEYMYFANSVVPSTSAELQVFLSVDNGSTFETSYFYNRAANGTAMADSEPSYDNTVNTANSHWLIGSVSLVNLSGLSMGVIGQTRATTVDDVKYCFMNVNGVVDAMRFDFSAGTFNAAGVISIWGR